MVRNFDYFIIGQGLAGSALAWELIQRGKSVMVYDEPKENRASAVAAGLFNPITGRVMTKTWKADELFPFLEKFYSTTGKTLAKFFFHSIPIFRPFVSAEEMQQWKAKSKSEEIEKLVLKFHDSPSFAQQVINPFGGIEIAQSGYLDTGLWISTVRDFLKRRGFYIQEKLEEEALLVDSLIRYKEYTADKIIFCNGSGALHSRWFSWLPLKLLKGETLDVKIETKPVRIFNRGVYLVPSAGENIYKVGATYQHAPFLEGPTPEAREDLKTKLTELIRLPFDIIHQDWGIRPTSPDRRPMLGPHPANKNVIIFNGLGTKGVSLSPYFAHQLADWLEGKGDLSTEVNIYRFKALYSE